MTRAAAYTPPCREAATETLADVDGWIRTIVSAYRRRYRDQTDPDDLLQEAYIAYLHALATWDMERASFKHWLHMRIFSKLFDRFRTEMRNAKYKRAAVDLDTVERYYAATPDTDPDMDEDALELYRMALNEPRVTTTDRLWGKARRDGWEASRFIAAFDRVGGCLR